MNSRAAYLKDAEAILQLVHSTIMAQYTCCYPAGVVDFFLEYHSMERITVDIMAGSVFVAEEGVKILGTGTIKGNYVGRVFVLPEHQRKGIGSAIMDRLESEAIKNKHKTVTLECALPAFNLYAARGYRSIRYEMEEVRPGSIICYHVMEKRLAVPPFGEITCRAVGFVQNDVKAQKDRGWGEAASSIVLLDEYRGALEGIKGFSHAVIVCYLHQAEFESAKHLIRRPQGREGMPMTGIFAQRAKDRPNHIGITAVEILDACDCTLTVRGLDAIDGTPVLDIKPYFPAFDCRHEATVPEWVDVLMEHYF